MGTETSDAGKPLGLIRGLGVWAATAVVVGSMIGQAVFLVASDMSREVNSMWKVLVVWIVGGVIVLFGALCYAELGAAIPEAGGDYVYLGRGIGPLWGFLYGWTFSAIMRPGAAAGIAAGLLRFIGFLAPFVTAPIFVSSLHLSFLSQPYQVTFTAAQPLAAIVVVFVTVLNYLGVRTVGRVQIFLTALKIATIIAILVFGVMANNPTSDRTALVESPAHGPIVAFLTALVPVMYATSDFNISVSWAGKF
jgi:APA family basic amino acid/polyamine antiporter